MSKRILYRADVRPPAEIFREGFQPRFPGGIKIQKGGQMIGGVSTSKDLSISMHYAGLYSGYLYAVIAEGTDVLQYLLTSKGISQGAIRNAQTQMEIACKNIPAEDIILARQVIFNENSGSVTFRGEIFRNELAIVSDNERTITNMLISLDNIIVPAVLHH